MISRATRGLVLLTSSCLIAFCDPLHFAAPPGTHDLGTAKRGSASSSAASEGPKAVFPEARFEFSAVMSGAVVEHDFIIKNEGSAPLVIQKVSMTTPLLVTRMPRVVAPGAQGTIHFKLDTANLVGKFDGAILVFLNDPASAQVVLTFAGHIVPAIELSPIPAFFVSGQRGRGGRAAIEIVNHQTEPLGIEKIEHPTERFTTELATLERGQRYRLTLTLKPNGPGGRTMDTILIRTSSKRVPVLRVAANTYLYERVHTFPEVVDLGTWRVSDAGDAALTLMVYQEGGSDFQAKLTTDVPALSVKWERGPKEDRYQATITLNAEKIKVGLINGYIFIDTNDLEFPRVIVPVHGQFVER